MARQPKYGPGTSPIDATSTMDNSKTCTICRGSGRIKLPVYDDLTVASLDDEGSAIPELTERERQYPCPECKGTSKIADQRPLGEKYSVIRVSNILRNDIKDPKYTESIENQIAHRIARIMLDRELIIFETREGPVYNRDDVSVMEGITGIVWPKGGIFDRVIAEESPEVTMRGGRTIMVEPTPEAIDLITKAALKNKQWVSPRTAAKLASAASGPKKKAKPVAPRSERDLILFEEPPDDEG